MALGAMMISGMFFTKTNEKNPSYADVVDIGVTVATNIIDSTPAISSVTLNCSRVNWEGMTPINDIVPLQNGEYKVDVSLSPSFSEIIESSGYRTGTSYGVATSLGTNQNYYYRLRARDYGRMTEESHYSSTVPCLTSSENNTPPSPGGGGTGSSYAATNPTAPLTPDTVPSAPPTAPSTDSALNWAKTIIVDPFIKKGGLDMSVETKTTSDKSQLIYVRPKNMPKDVTNIARCSAPMDAASILSHTKEGTVGIRPSDPNMNNILFSYLDEQTHTWEFIPTYSNNVKKTLDFKAMGIGTYMMTKVINAGGVFKDSKPDDWFRSFAENVRMMKINSGDGNGNFAGNAEIRRGEAYAMIAKAFNTTIPVKYVQRNYFTPISRGEALEVLLTSTGFTSTFTNISLPFSDVLRSSSIYPFVSYAFQLGIIKGFDDNTFRSNATVTRAEMAKIVIKTLEERYLLKTIANPEVNNYLCNEVANGAISMRKIFGEIFTIIR